MSLLTSGLAHVALEIYAASHAHGVDPDRLENVREVCTKIVRYCGLWGATMPVADLGVALTQGKAMFQLGVSTPDPAIDHQSLVPGMKATFYSLHYRLSNDEKALWATELGMALETLGEWMWDCDLDSHFHTILCDTRMIFADCKDLLHAGAH